MCAGGQPKAGSWGPSLRCCSGSKSQEASLHPVSDGVRGELLEGALAVSSPPPARRGELSANLSLGSLH